MDALRVADLHKRYADGTHALRGLDLRIPAGCFFGLLGPNGSGKTTLIGMAAGLVRAPAGRIFVFERDAVADAGRARLALGVAPQEIHLDRFLTAREVLTYHGRYFGLLKREAEERADELLATFDLGSKAGTNPHRLSGGMRRRLLLARALVHRPPLVILDEPTAGVDLELRHELWRYLRRLQVEEATTVLLTTHYLEEAEALCERVAFIRDGRIVADGSPRELVARYGGERLEDAYLGALSSRPSPAPDDAGGAMLHSRGSPVPLRTAVLRPARSPRTPEPPEEPEQRRVTQAADLRRVELRGTAALASRELRRVFALWTQTILPPVVSAGLFLLVFGGALGDRIRQLEGIDYLEFILPGVLVMTVATQAFHNNATSLFQAKSEGYVDDVLSSPLRAWQLVLAYSAGGFVRSLVAAAVLAGVAAPFAGGPGRAGLVLATLVLTAAVFSVLGVITGMWADSFDQQAFVATLVLGPLALVAGVFYSAGTLPEPWETLTRLNPLFYLVDAARDGYTGFHETTPRSRSSSPPSRSSRSSPSRRRCSRGAGA